MRHTGKSRSIDLLGRLHTDIGFQDRYLLNHVTLRVRLTRAKDTFSLLTNQEQPDYKVVLQDVQMHVRKVQLSPPLQLCPRQGLGKSPGPIPDSTRAHQVLRRPPRPNSRQRTKFVPGCTTETSHSRHGRQHSLRRYL